MERFTVEAHKPIRRLSSFGRWIADSTQSLFYGSGSDFGVLLSPYRKLHSMNLMARIKRHELDQKSAEKNNSF